MLSQEGGKGAIHCVQIFSAYWYVCKIFSFADCQQSPSLIGGSSHWCKWGVRRAMKEVSSFTVLLHPQCLLGFIVQKPPN